METLEKNTIATLKPELVNEFEFTPRRERIKRFSEETHITHPYTSDYEAIVAVKIGNTVKELKFNLNSHYVNSYHKADGTYVKGESFEWLGLDKSTNPFEELENVGIVVNYLHILIQYQDMVKNAKYREALMKRYEAWVNIRKAKKSLIDSWIHKFEATIKSDNNKKIKEAVKETTFVPSTKYGSKHHINITYKGITVPIHMVDGSFAFNNSQYEWAMNLTAIDKEKKSVKIADDKLRKAKREGTLFLKAIEAIDEYFAIIESEKKRKEKKVSETEKRKDFLSKTLEYPVIVIEERKYSRERRSDHSWMEQKYFLLLEQPKDRWESGKRINISYNDYINHFSVNGLNDLREDQFKSIVEILIDGRKPLKKLIIPEKK